MANATVKDKYLAISFISLGSSWLHGNDQEDLIKRLPNLVRRDWGHLFDFKHDPKIYVYELPDDGEWYATSEGVFAATTNEKMKCVRTVAVIINAKTGEPVKRTEVQKRFA